jgi:hypothetical protein
MDVVFQAFINKYPILSIAINDMVFFEKNIYNENLSKIEDTYSTYYEDDDPIRQGYYKLFSKLCSMENKDGLVRHVIMFSNSKILKAFNDILAINASYGPAFREKAETNLAWAYAKKSLFEEKIAAALEDYKKYMSLTDVSTDAKIKYADFLILSKKF